MNPPTNTLKGGISFRKYQTQIGAQSVSVNISKPIVVACVVLEPIVIAIKPKANWGTPNIKPISMSWFEKLNDSEKFAIIYHGGAYETSRFELAGKEDMLQIITHAADMLSSRYDQVPW